MTRLLRHAPPAAPAVLVAESAAGRVGGLAALAAAGCALGGLLLMAGPGPEPEQAPRIVAVAASTVPGQVPDPVPPRPGQPVPALPSAAAAIGVPAPAWGLAAADAASTVPEIYPPPVDPAVEQALSRLRVAAAAGHDGRRPGADALAALDHAFDQVGDPYVWGATGPAAFDCSGLTQWAYQAAGVDLPRVSRDQFAAGGQPVEVDELLPGDLVFFATATWDPGVVHHVGMYAGSGLMVDAPRPGLAVRVEPVSAQGFVGAVRPVPAGEPAEQEPEKADGASTKGREHPDRPDPSSAAAPSGSPSSSPSGLPDPTGSPAAPAPASPSPSAPATPSAEPTPTAATEPTATPAPTGATATPVLTTAPTLAPLSPLLRLTLLQPAPTIRTR